MPIALLASVAALIVNPTMHVSTTSTVTSRSAPLQAVGLGSSSGSLPEMYRERWRMMPERIDKDKDILVEEMDVEDMAATALGATIGVCSMAALGVFTSVALTDYSLTLIGSTWGYGGAFDISPFLSTITGWVERANSLPSFAECVFALAVTIDVAALASVIALAMQTIEKDALETVGAGYGMGGYGMGGYGRMGSESSEAEMCLHDGSVCGPASFDSSLDYACIEQMVNGKLQWVCA
jgi:hypothetical protein